VTPLEDDLDDLPLVDDRNAEKTGMGADRAWTD
jgi:hypothetical protein